MNKCWLCQGEILRRPWQKPHELAEQIYCSRQCANEARRESPVTLLSRHSVTNQESGCVEWTACRDKKGYGRMSPQADGEVLAHRVSYLVCVGPIPDGLNVLHHCDNPRCINPSHLFLGTNGDNNADRVAKGRSRGAVGVRNGKAALSEADVLRIRDDPRTQSAIAREYGVDPTTVSCIKRGATWTHLGRAT